METSDPSRSPSPETVDGSDPTRESISSKRIKRKKKSYKLHDCIRKHIDDLLILKHLVNVGS